MWTSSWRAGGGLICVFVFSERDGEKSTVGVVVGVPAIHSSHVLILSLLHFCGPCCVFFPLVNV